MMCKASRKNCLFLLDPACDLVYLTALSYRDKDHGDVESLNPCGCEHLLRHDKRFEQGGHAWVSVERCTIRGCERILHYHHKSVKEGPHAESPASCGQLLLGLDRWP